MPTLASPLAYCANVHPGPTLPQVAANIDRYTAPVAARLRAETGDAVGVGLWFARRAAEEAARDPVARRDLADRLRRAGAVCTTLNAFPYGDFHAARVKDAVYQPDWSTVDRRDYTLRCAEILADLLPDGADGSLSTLPLAFKDHAAGRTVETFLPNLLDAADELARLERRVGKRLRLAIEPEPFCLLETTGETLDFFRRLREAAAVRGTAAVVDRHLGVCYDVCHQAVEYEDAGDALTALVDAGIPIPKVQLSCALELTTPADAAARAFLASFAEERYLHQTFVRSKTGRISARVDLTAELASNPPADWLDAESWRIHFHVPIDAEMVGPLSTTRPALAQCLRTLAELAPRLPVLPHLEVETYTWGVLPSAVKTAAGDATLVDGLAAELRAADGLAAAAGWTPAAIGLRSSTIPSANQHGEE
ncbi:MAG: metabolite traffic protein EboE [Planctomycetia bacterium]